MIYSITKDGDEVTLKNKQKKGNFGKKKLEENTIKMKRMKKTNKL